MSSRCLRATAAIAGCALALGCATRTGYQPAVPSTPPAWAAVATGTTAGAVDEDALSRWWEGFNDSQLTSLIVRGVRGNLDIRLATSRIRESRASLASTRARLRPTVDVSPSASASRSSGQSGFGGLGAAGIVRELYNVGFDSSWEADVFGAIRSSIDSASATAEVREAELQDVLVTLAAEVALDYIDLRSLQQRLTIATANAATQQETLDITRLRMQAGLATDLDVQQASSNVENTRAQMAALDAQVRTAIHALGVLIGQPPAALNEELSVPGEVPRTESSLAMGIPADTLRRRPDVRSAERQLAAQFAQVNAARAELKPSFRLAGSIGLESLSLARLFIPGASFWNVQSNASQRVFNREQLRQNVAVQTERQRQAAVAYESRVLVALQEVEDALVAFANEQLRRDHLSNAVAAAQEAAELSLQLYTAGLRDFRGVLDAQRSLLTLQDTLASSTGAVSSDLVRIYKALGGGWSSSSVVDVDRASEPR